MANKRRLEVEIAGDARGAKKAFDDSDKAADSWSTKMKGKLSEVGPMLAAGAVAGVAAVGALGVSSYNAAIESQKINKETARVIETTGASAWTSADQVSAYAGSLSEATGADDEMIQSGANLLLTFTKIQNKLGEGNDVFDQATQAALDMSTVLGTDMRSESLRLGQALNDPITGLTKLRKAGVSFSDQQKDQIRTMTEAGDILGAQKVILGELAVEFGGAAEAAGTPLEKLMVKVGNVQEAFGAQLIPMVDGAIAGFEEFGRIIGPSLESIGGNLAEIWTKVGPVAEAFAKLTGGAIVGGILAITYGIDALTGLLADNDAVFAAFATTLVLVSGHATYLGTVALAKALVTGLTVVMSTAAGATNALGLFGGQMTTTGGMVAGAGILVAGAAASWAIWSNAMEETGDAAEGIGDQIDGAVKFDSFDAAKDRVGAINTEISGLSDTIENSSAPWDAEYRAGLSQLGAELETSGTAIQQMVGNAEAMSTATGDSTDKTWAWIQSQQEAGITFPTTAAAVDAYTGSVDTSTVSAQDAAVAMEAQRIAAQDLNDVMRAQVDPLFAMNDAQRKLNEAQEKADQLLREGKGGTDEWVLANDAATRAAFDLQYASNTLNGELGAQPDLMAGAVGGLEKMVEQGLITQTQADQMRGAFELATGQAQVLGGQEINVPVTAHTQEFYDRVAAMLNWAAAQSVNVGLNVGNAVGRGVKGFASGGSPGNGMFVVGEQGPELMSKQGSSLRVFSNSDSRAMAGGKSGGDVHVTVAPQPIYLDGKQVGEVVGSYFVQKQKLSPNPVLPGVGT